MRTVVAVSLVSFVGIFSARCFFMLAEDWHGLEPSPESIASRLREQFPCKLAFVDLCGALARAEGFRLCNQRLRGGRGLVGYLYDKGGIERWDEAERRTERVADGLKAIGVPFLYVMVPTKIDLSGELFPAGWNGCNLNRDAATFLARLSEQGVSVQNLIPALAADADAVSRNFYKTDHHWTTRAALKAAGLVQDRLVQMPGTPGMAHHRTLWLPLWRADRL